jgi:hypothetical protein
VTLLHFRALDCDELADGTAYLRASTDVDCASPAYQAAKAWVAALLGCYMLVPLWFAAFLWTERFTINPALVPGKANGPGDVAAVLALRERHRCDCRCRFLWEDYLPSCYLFEVVEVVRRMFFVAVLPLCGDGVARATFGCLGALVWAVGAREVRPFVDPAANDLLTVSSVAVFVTYLGALAVASGSLGGLGLSDFGLGVGLLLANLGVVAVCGAWVYQRHAQTEERKHWKQGLSEEQVRVLDLVMHADTGDATAKQLGAVLSSGGGGGGGLRGSFAPRDPQTIMKQYVLFLRPSAGLVCPRARA